MLPEQSASPSLVKHCHWSRRLPPNSDLDEIAGCQNWHHAHDIRLLAALQQVDSMDWRFMPAMIIRIQQTIEYATCHPFPHETVWVIWAFRERWSGIQHPQMYDLFAECVNLAPSDVSVLVIEFVFSVHGKFQECKRLRCLPFQHEIEMLARMVIRVISAELYLDDQSVLLH